MLTVNVQFQSGNALALDFPDGAFAAATVGFGARNFSDLEQGLREMTRVVRPGGHVVVLEITTPTRPPLSTFFDLWFDRLDPGARPGRGRLPGVQLPAELGQALPGPRAARSAHGGRGAHLGALRDHRRGHHRPPRRGGAVVSCQGTVAS